MLEALLQRSAEVTDAIETLEAKIVAEGRSDAMTPEEQHDLDALYARAEQMKPELLKASERADLVNAGTTVTAKYARTSLATRSTPTRPTAEQPGAEPTTAGEWMALRVRAIASRSMENEVLPPDPEAVELFKRALDTMTTAETGGALPVPILGPVIKFHDSSRPVWNSFTSRPMPTSGKTFTRPRVTQRVTVGAQSSELAEISSQNMALTGDTVTKATYAGGLRISEQDLDWTDPAMLQLVIEDFVEVYAEATEAVACAKIVALATTTADWVATNIGTIIGSITAGITSVYGTAKKMPDTVWLSLDEYLSLAGTTNSTTNVSALALVRQTLAEAETPMKFVVGPQLAADTRIVGVSSLVESYEHVKGLLSAPVVSNLGVDIAYRGYAATYGRAEGFCKLVVP